MTDVIIIGGGPAGISAALYTVRAGLKTQIIYKDLGALTKAERIENFYGQHFLPTGKALVQAGLEQAEQLGIVLTQNEVIKIELDECFTVCTNDAVYTAHAVIMATGAKRNAPSIKGLAEYEGRGVSYCAVCDAFFYKGKDVVVLGTGEYAKQEAHELEPLVNSVTFIEPGDVAEIAGENTVTAVKLKNGGEIPAAGVFVAIGIAGGTELAKKLGTRLDNVQTDIPGFFAAGDCLPGMKQIAKAVYDGALAGTEAIKYIRDVIKNEQ